MAGELYQQRDPNTSWWHETPSLVSQTTHLTGFNSSTESNPFDITPSVSSGYFDEEDQNSNVSEGSLGGRGVGVATTYASAPTVAPYQRTDSDWSNASTITEGHRGGCMMGERPSTVNDFTGQTESTNTLVEGVGVVKDTPLRYPSQPPKPPPHRRPSGRSHDSRGPEVSVTVGVASTEQAQYPIGTGIPVAPVHRTEDHTPSKAFAKERDDHHFRQSSDSGNEVPEGGGGGAHMEMNFLTHSMSAANQDIIRYLSPLLLQNISPMNLLPYLKSRSLLSDDDIDFLYDPSHTHKEKVKRIVLGVPNKDMDAMETFVDCLEMDSTHQGHAYLAKRFKEAMEKKRLYPFKRLSSLRNKGQSHTPPKPPPRTDSNTRHMISTDLPSATTSGNHLTSSHSSSSVGEEKREEVKPKVPPKKLRRSQQPLSSPSVTFQKFNYDQTSSEMRMSQSMDPLPFMGDNFKTGMINESTSISRSSNYKPYAGNFSSLPRTPSQSSALDTDSRGTKPYSSARYAPADPPKPSPTHNSSSGKRKGLWITRNASFHSGMEDRRVIVTPLDVNAGGTLSEDTDDDGYLYRQGSIDRDRERGGASSKGSSSSSSSGYHNRKPAISLPQPYVPPHRRTHDVILEDPSAAPGGDTNADNRSGMDPGLRSPATFPRQVPGRSHSMHVQGERGSSSSRGNVAGFAGSGNPVRFTETSSAMVIRDGSSTRSGCGLQRGGSLHTPRNYNATDDFHPLPGSNLARESVRDLQADNEEASDKLGELVSPVLRQHRRTRSYEPTNVPPQSPGKMAPSSQQSATPSRRGVSEYFPPPSVLEESLPEHNAEVTVNVVPSGGVVEGGASGVTYVGAAQDINQQKMFKKKMQWLQQKIKFKDFPEEVDFDSVTHYRSPREIIYSGTLYEKGKSRFVILLTDMLLVLKPKKKGKFGGRGNSQHQFIDWFTDVDCKARTPFLLHLLSIQAKSRRAFSESFILHYNKGSSLKKITLHAVSKEAKDIWLDHLFDSIRACTTANAECAVPLRPSAIPVQGKSSHNALSLTIKEANNIAYSSQLNTKNHFCVVTVGPHKCRTPAVPAKCWPTWNYKVHFCDFELQDILRIDFYTERLSCPDCFLGFVEINLESASQKHQQKLGLSEMQLKNQNLPLKEGRGTLTVDFELKWDKTAHQQ